MTRRFRDARDLSRSARPKREPRPDIIIVCEGKVTEPHYFETFRDLYGNSLVRVTTIGGCGVPVSVVEQAIVEKAKKEAERRKSGDSFEVFEVWAVFDRDAHPQGQVPSALKQAQENGISVAFSNPCFEVWGLMHFSCYSRPGHHHETQASLRAALPGYCHERNPRFSANALKERYPQAVINADRALRQRREEGNDEHGDPSTTVHLLTERIKSFGKA